MSITNNGVKHSNVTINLMTLSHDKILLIDHQTMMNDIQRILEASI